jgi:hypothetical protein
MISLRLMRLQLMCLRLMCLRLMRLRVINWLERVVLLAPSGGHGLASAYLQRPIGTLPVACRGAMART